ncbi:MAG: response regulator [Candidatus Krumholzibacteria bacterium]|nr:response regulator [Candidatus Krumholzibacteria bacterium]
MHQYKDQPVVILLVEDDPGDQELTRRAFKESKIHSDLYIAENGEEALDYLHRQGKYQDAEISPWPHLILLDLNMPKINGKEFLVELRSDRLLRRIPVVVLTTSKHEEDVLRSYDLGVNSYITKPASMDEFVRLINTLESYWFELVQLPPSGD